MMINISCHVLEEFMYIYRFPEEPSEEKESTETFKAVTRENERSQFIINHYHNKEERESIHLKNGRKQAFKRGQKNGYQKRNLSVLHVLL